MQLSKHITHNPNSTVIANNKKTFFLHKLLGLSQDDAALNDVKGFVTVPFEGSMSLFLPGDFNVTFLIVVAIIQFVLRINNKVNYRGLAGMRFLCRSCISVFLLIICRCKVKTKTLVSTNECGTIFCKTPIFNFSY
jgi:hypothetical protein